MAIALIWFRDDLRLDDNPALQAALARGYQVLPLFIHAPHEEGDWAPGAASDAWRARSLSALDASLRARGARLHCVQGDSLATLSAFAQANSADAVFWNRRYEPAIEARDAAIKRALRADGLQVESFNGALLREPWQVETQQGDPYKVFSAYWKTASATHPGLHLSLAPAELPTPRTAGVHMAGPDTLRALCGSDWDGDFWQHATPGEAGARVALRRFIDNGLEDYAAARDRPALDGTSRLSSHLHFGEISVQRVLSEIQASKASPEAIAAFARQLGWREFGYHLLHHYPHTAERNLNPRLDDLQWAKPDPGLLAAWQRGRTGIPIIDAGMRQLWQTGWMHNRVRMLVASVLTKNLRMHWSLGARWFWDTLVDADLANNTMGWQWVAGTGADAAPYFRIFNPVLQGQRFDADGAYVRRWLPELAGLPVTVLHAPWQQPDLLRRTAPKYPRAPIVDLAASREMALAAYQELRSAR
jgi:deoxyribodipyrimidine photo-lyase